MTKTILFITAFLCCSFVAAQPAILVQSTTSTANSGLYEYLLPEFEAAYNIQVQVVAVGTGQAIRNAGNCDADVLLVHAKQAEDKFIADGFGVKRFDLMYNDFVLVGPMKDPAEIRSSNNAKDALIRIASQKAMFTSRGDNSGTHKKELQLWTHTGINLEPYNGKWYRETGSGMGATLNTTVGLNAYTLTDRATWISFKNKQNHTIVLEGDNALFNQYGVILVNKKKCPRVNSTDGQTFINWLTGTEGQALIASYTLNGEQLFYPNAKP